MSNIKYRATDYIISSILTLFILSTPLQANQHMSLSEYEDKWSNLGDSLMPKIVVTATRFAQPITNPATTQVITSEELSQLGISTLKDALNNISNISVGNAGGVHTLRMRGLSSNKYKLLLNGIELKDPVSTDGIPFLEGVNLGDVDRIEIVSGTQGTLYGSDAIAGTIQIFTKQNSSNNYIKTTLANNANKTEFNYAASLENTSFILNASKQYNNQKSWLTNTTEKDHTDLNTVSLMTSKDLGRIKLNAFFLISELNQDLDDFYSGDTSDTTNKQHQLFSINSQSKVNSNLTTKVSYSYSSLKRTTTKTASISVYDGKINKLDIENNWRLNKNLHFIFGADRKIETGKVDDSWGAFPRTSQTVQGLYSQANFNMGLVGFNTGFRRDYYSGKTNDTHSVSISGDIPHTLLSVHTSLATGFRSPSLYERFNANSANADLLAESSHTKEISFISNYFNLESSITLFKSEITNKIGYNNTTNAYYNLTDKTNSSGTEYAVTTLKLGPVNFVRLAYTKTDSLTGGTQSLKIPNKTLSLSTSSTFWNTTIGVTGRYIGKQYDYGDIDTIVIPAYKVFNLNIDSALTEDLNLTLKINNLLNENYEEVYGFQTLGRNISVGLKKTI